jgi:hypothetical protein
MDSLEETAPTSPRAHNRAPPDELPAGPSQVDRGLECGRFGARDERLVGYGRRCPNRQAAPWNRARILYVTLEDETGITNAIVTPDVFQQQRALLRRAKILKIGGPLQKVDGVIHVRARTFR